MVKPHSSGLFGAVIDVHGMVIAHPKIMEGIRKALSEYQEPVLNWKVNNNA